MAEGVDSNPRAVADRRFQDRDVKIGYNFGRHDQDGSDWSCSLYGYEATPGRR
jgi:hypothetical protein